MTEQALKILVDRFDNLTMRNPAINASHPYEFLSNSFPAYNDFYNYFIDLAPANGEDIFGDVLFDLYHDLRNLPVIVSGMNNGIKPDNMEKTFASVRKFAELARKKYAQANARLAHEYSIKH